MCSTRRRANTIDSLKSEPCRTPLDVVAGSVVGVRVAVMWGSRRVRGRRGEGEEHVVEGGLAAIDVDGVDAGVVEGAHEVDEAACRRRSAR